MMKVGFSPISFRASENQLNLQNNKPQTLGTVQNQDSSILQAEAPKTRKSIRERIAGVWKFFASANRLIQAYAKGIAYATVTGFGVLSASWLFNSLPKAFMKNGPKLSEVVKHPLTHISRSGKIFAVVGAVGAMGYQALKGHLSANQRTADIDHQLRVGHRDS